jgi:UDP-N-acetylglucosamine diphosphorylase / glucose-1-phosphate thymidylyltransferase / UDP-N-acetylgalactosamine diphosphorylase / glucosamine-1-phosphate N-acetyltransferase / galactosamine-1-phosphate N-acetyltransferase
MIAITDYIQRFELLFAGMGRERPWDLTGRVHRILQDKLADLSSDFKIFDDVAIHKSANVDRHAIIKGPAIISADCFVGAHAYLRGGVLLDEKVSIGPGCEVKSSLIFSQTALGHFNFVGDSILGSGINLEAGAVIANHYNERSDKNIPVLLDGKLHMTGCTKFGALVGDLTKIGANSVLSPGTILPPSSIVARLQLIDQARM